ncbi:YhcN/YlaJ family sporulation lipoprotein [Clostridium botulinum C]|uniref:YhcN/YlaJ family sporulation lipoprotein n=1 Tax=Clostridium botulinum TaxID=1491 RepID=UPI001E3C9AD3|nr:YhcN/YlaJ family sporulation lipoprotein [Clostridium botulinum C]
MNLNKRKGILALVTAFILSLSMVACNSTNKKATPPENITNKTTKEKTMDKSSNENINESTKNGISGTTKTENYSSERIRKIEDAVNKIKYVKGSSVIITGDKALVGIKLEGNVEDAKTKEIKAEVERVVKKTDKNLKSVAVSADIALFTRISKVGEGLRSGRPFSEFTNEVEEIFRRILPQ